MRLEEQNLTFVFIVMRYIFNFDLWKQFLKIQNSNFKCAYDVG